MMRLNTLGIAHKIIAEHVQPGDLCIDATAGRGHDTAFLCELVGKEGKVLAFDIQQAAVDSTRALLAEKSGEGKTKEVKALLNKYDAGKLSGVKPEDYPALMEEARSL